mmetsp:Transcript_13851/g.31113  ORF Transcript_13851/g.31113 Transcript_13851/m.31113 type:complete len:268 (+) Transcript_13851:30-833(+)
MALPQSSLGAILLLDKSCLSLKLLFPVCLIVQVWHIRGVLWYHPLVSDVLLIVLPILFSVFDNALEWDAMHLYEVFVVVIALHLGSHQRTSSSQHDPSVRSMFRTEEICWELLVWLPCLVHRQLVVQAALYYLVVLGGAVPEVDHGFRQLVIAWSSSCRSKRGGVDTICLAGHTASEVTVDPIVSHLPNLQELVHFPIRKTTRAFQHAVTLKLAAILQVERLVRASLDVADFELHQAIGGRKEVHITNTKSGLLLNVSSAPRCVALH